MKLNFIHPISRLSIKNAITVFLLAFLVGCGTNEKQTNSSLPTSAPSLPSTEPTPSNIVTKPEVTASPSVTDPYQDAISKALGAATITQSAQSQGDWSLIVGMWQEAINLMETVPKASSNYALVKTKIQEYQNNLKFAQQMALKPPATANPEPLQNRISNTVPTQNNKNNVQPVIASQNLNFAHQIALKHPSIANPEPLQNRISNTVPTQNNKNNVQPVIASQSLNQNYSLNTSNKQTIVRVNATNIGINKIYGYLKLVDSKIAGTDNNCYGTGGFEDIEESMPVTIKDGQGKILALGKTSYGKRPKGQYSEVTCTFYFQVNNVPKSDFYSIEVGRRGQLNYSYEELKSKNWKVSFSLASSN